MADESLLNVQFSQQAQAALLSLGEEDRRVLNSLFSHLRNWRNDEFIRTRSKRLRQTEDVFVFETTTDLLFAFELEGEVITVLSIFRRDVLRAFEAGLAKARA